MSYDEAAERLCYAADLYREAYAEATAECAGDLAHLGLDEARTILYEQAARFVKGER